MTSETTEKKNTTRDHLLAVFAAVFAHPGIYSDVAAFVNDSIIGDDKAVKTLWTYLHEHSDSPNFLEASVELTLAGVEDAHALMSGLREQAVDLTPKRAKAVAQKLARAIINTRRREHVKRVLESSPVGSLDIEALAAEAAEKYPHVAAVKVPPNNLCALFEEWEKDEQPDKIPSGFPQFDVLSGGLDIGITEIAGRSGDGKTAVLIAFALTLVFPNVSSFADRHNPHRRCESRKDDARPYVLFISAEMPRKAMLSRLACSLAVVDGGAIARERRHALAQSTVDWNHVLGEIRAHGRLSLLDAETLGAVTPEAVCAAMNTWAADIRRNDPDATLVVCLDYLQFLDTDGDGERYEQLQDPMRQVLRVTNKHRLVTLVGLQAKDAEPGKYRPATRADIQSSKAVINDGSAVYIVRRDPNCPSALGLYSEKARAGDKGWEAKFHFEGRYMSLTEAPEQTVDSTMFDEEEVTPFDM